MLCYNWIDLHVKKNVSFVTKKGLRCKKKKKKVEDMNDVNNMLKKDVSFITEKDRRCNKKKKKKSKT